MEAHHPESLQAMRSSLSLLCNNQFAWWCLSTIGWRWWWPSWKGGPGKVCGTLPRHACRGYVIVARQKHAVGWQVMCGRCLSSPVVSTPSTRAPPLPSTVPVFTTARPLPRRAACRHRYALYTKGGLSGYRRETQIGVSKQPAQSRAECMNRRPVIECLLERCDTR